MKSAHEPFKIQIVRRSQKMGQRRSADHRHRDKIRDRQGTPVLGTDKIRQTIVLQQQKTGCLNTIFHKELESRTFAQKCVTLLSKKKISGEESAKRSNFNSMLQNIKNVIKGERREKEMKVDSEPLCNNQFQCARTQIHQIYSHQEKVQLYRMLRNSESRGGHRRDSNKSQKGQKTQSQSYSPLRTPFTNQNTIICLTMALNNPNQMRRQTMFEPPITRNSFSACNKRTVTISRSMQPKHMAFNLSGDNDGQYCRKLKNYLDFIFKVNFSNGLYVSLQLNKPEDISSLPKYKVYIGRGNNSLLIKSLMRRRFWWQLTDKIQTGAHFYWSQNIITKIENKQLKAQPSQASKSKVGKKRKDQEEGLDLNRKILCCEKSKKVEQFITKDGFLLPFEEAFVPDSMTNHVPRNYCIGSKKNLFKSLFHYFTYVKHKDPFEYIPKTYHIRTVEDEQYKSFMREGISEPERVWIVKPGQNSNQGRHIRLSTFRDVGKLIRKAKHQNGQDLTYIVQSYINKPLLYNGRKFDIRHFMMITSINGQLKAYWYRDGYLRTASQAFDLQDIDNQFIHLTNDAIQKQSEDYQKYQPANKLSYSELQRHLDYSYPSKNCHFERDIIPQMKEIASYIVRANYRVLDHKRHQNNFQIFGLDFMLDRDFKPWLIEVNYNPCLEVSCPLLERVIPVMLQHSLRLALDPLFPPTCHYPPSKRFDLSDNYIKNLKYELIFDEDSLRSAIKNNYEFVDQKEEEEEYQDEGHQVGELPL